MIIDFHTHIFPDKIAGAAVSFLERQSGEKAFTDGTLAGLKDSMRRCGIDVSVVMPVATKPEQTVSINNFAAKTNGEDGIISFGSMHPACESWREELQRIKTLGLPGIKLHPDYQKAFIDETRMVDIMRECGRLGLIVLTHSGVDIGYPEPVHCTPERIASILPEIKGTTLVAAHYGGHLCADTTLRFLGGTGVYIDTSYSHTCCDKEQLKELLLHFDADRILFASDSPWDEQDNALGFIRGLRLGPAKTEDILYNNAKKILKV